MKVLVNGIGNIGTTVLNVLARFQDILGITQIYALKNTLHPWNHIDLEHLTEQGIIICTRDQITGYEPIDRVLNTIDYIFDCTANHIGLKNKNWYANLPNLQGCCAQGSEKGFGLPFMTGINDTQINGQKFVQIVSCNTHSLTAILKTFTRELTETPHSTAAYDLPKLITADFVIVRRSEDLGQHERLVSANVVSRHMSADTGTHHAIDVTDLLLTKGLNPHMTSSDITTPSQLMHGVRFNLEFDGPFVIDPKELLASAPLLAGTHKFDSNVIFEQGRRYGFLGRLYSHAIIVDNNFLHSENALKGWAFIPQEGCTILSTIHAYLLQTQHPKATDIMLTLSNALLRKRW